jgi:hypothetical protein
VFVKVTLKRLILNILGQLFKVLLGQGSLIQLFSQAVLLIKVIKDSTKLTNQPIKLIKFKLINCEIQYCFF